MYQVLVGDNRDTLKTLPDGSVHCCVTSPPYWGLRDYGTAEWEGGDAECDHAPPDDAPNGNKGQPQTHAGRHSGDCRKCGAKRIDRQLGLEKTPTCGLHGKVRIRRDLSEDQIARVARWLLGDQPLGGVKDGNDDKA